MGELVKEQTEQDILRQAYLKRDQFPGLLVHETKGNTFAVVRDQFWKESEPCVFFLGVFTKEELREKYNGCIILNNNYFLTLLTPSEQRALMVEAFKRNEVPFEKILIDNEAPTKEEWENISHEDFTTISFAHTSLSNRYLTIPMSDEDFEIRGKMVRIPV